VREVVGYEGRDLHDSSADGTLKPRRIGLLGWRAKILMRE